MTSPSSGASPAPPSLESQILTLLVGVAPDVDPAGVQPGVEFRDQFDFDSMDLFNFAAAIHQTFGIEIPERDYRSLTSLASSAAYVRGKLAGPA